MKIRLSSAKIGENSCSEFNSEIEWLLSYDGDEDDNGYGVDDKSSVLFEVSIVKICSEEEVDDSEKVALTRVSIVAFVCLKWSTIDFQIALNVMQKIERNLQKLCNCSGKRSIVRKLFGDESKEIQQKSITIKVIKVLFDEKSKTILWFVTHGLIQWWNSYKVETANI